MSAFRGKADLMRTCRVMSPSDPKYDIALAAAVESFPDFRRNTVACDLIGCVALHGRNAVLRNMLSKTEEGARRARRRQARCASPSADSDKIHNTLDVFEHLLFRLIAFGRLRRQPMTADRQ